MTNEELASKIRIIGQSLSREYDLMAIQIQQDATKNQKTPLIQAQMMGVVWASLALLRQSEKQLNEPRTTETSGGGKTPLPKSAKAKGGKTAKAADKIQKKRSVSSHKS